MISVSQTQVRVCVCVCVSARWCIPITPCTRGLYVRLSCQEVLKVSQLDYIVYCSLWHRLRCSQTTQESHKEENYTTRMKNRDVTSRARGKQGSALTCPTGVLAWCRRCVAHPLSTSTEHIHWAPPLNTSTEHLHRAHPLNTSTEHKDRNFVNTWKTLNKLSSFASLRFKSVFLFMQSFN